MTGPPTTVLMRSLSLKRDDVKASLRAFDAHVRQEKPDESLLPLLTLARRPHVVASPRQSAAHHPRKSLGMLAEEAIIRSEPGARVHDPSL